MHQRSDALLLVLQSLSRESCSSAQLFCFLLTIQNVTHWWRIDAKLMGNEKDVKQRTNKLFKRRADLHLRLDFTEGAGEALKMGRLWIFFLQTFDFIIWLSYVKAHQDAWKFFWSQSREKTMGVHVIKVAINELMWWALTCGSHTNKVGLWE